jgi:hypothetical protein
MSSDELMSSHLNLIQVPDYIINRYIKQDTLKSFIWKPKAFLVKVLTEFCEGVSRVEQTIERVQINKVEVVTHVAFLIFEALKVSLS